jgi:hypothetical protein
METKVKIINLIQGEADQICPYCIKGFTLISILKLTLRDIKLQN